MKKIILIISILLSLNLYSNNSDKKSNFKLGASLGVFTSSGFSLEYSFTDKFSIKASGFLIKNFDKEDKSIYEARLSSLYELTNNSSNNLYFIASIFKGKSFPMIQFGGGNNDPFPLEGLSAGFGLKSKMSEITSFIVELQYVAVLANRDKTFHLPNINIGLSFNL